MKKSDWDKLNCFFKDRIRIVATKEKLKRWKKNA